MVLLAAVELGVLGLEAVDHGGGGMDNLRTTRKGLLVENGRKYYICREYVRSDKTEETARDAAAGDVAVQEAVGAAVALDGEAIVGAQHDKGDEDELKGELHDGLAHGDLGVSLGDDLEGGVQEHQAGERNCETTL